MRPLAEFEKKKDYCHKGEIACINFESRRLDHLQTFLSLLVMAFLAVVQADFAQKIVLKEVRVLYQKERCIQIKLVCSLDIHSL